MNNLNEQISKYLEYCQYQKRLDEKTLKAYRIDLRQFTEQIPPTDIPNISQSREIYLQQNILEKIFRYNFTWQSISTVVDGLLFYF